MHANSSSSGGGNTTSPDSTTEQPPTQPQLPWAADELPVVELLSLLHWLQQHVVRLQLAPGGSADLYLDPDPEVYAAVRVPLLAMQSRPTLISGGSVGVGEWSAATQQLQIFLDVVASRLRGKHSCSVCHSIY